MRRMKEMKNKEIWEENEKTSSNVSFCSTVVWLEGGVSGEASARNRLNSLDIDN